MARHHRANHRDWVCNRHATIPHRLELRPFDSTAVGDGFSYFCFVFFPFKKNASLLELVVLF